MGVPCAAKMALLLLFLAGVSAAPSHMCEWEGKPYLTECCAYQDIYYCASSYCLTVPGCRVCSRDVCWPSPVPGVSVKPGGHSWAEEVCSHFELHSWLAYVAGVGGVGELYGAGLIAGLAAVSAVPASTPPLNCSVECTWGYEVMLGPVRSWLLELGSSSGFWLLQLPGALWSFVASVSPVFLVLLALLFLEGRWPLIVALVAIRLLVCPAEGLHTLCANRGDRLECPWGELWLTPRDGCKPGMGVTEARPGQRCPRPLPRQANWVCISGSWSYWLPGGGPYLAPFCSTCCLFGPTTSNGFRCLSHCCLMDERPAKCGSCYHGGCSASLRMGENESCICGPKISDHLRAIQYVNYTPGLRIQLRASPQVALHGALVPLTLTYGPYVYGYDGPVFWAARPQNATWPAGLYSPLPGEPLWCSTGVSCVGAGGSHRAATPPGYAWTRVSYAGSLVVSRGWQAVSDSVFVPVTYLLDLCFFCATLLSIARARFTLLLFLAGWLWLRGGIVWAYPLDGMAWFPVESFSVPPTGWDCSVNTDYQFWECVDSTRYRRAIVCRAFTTTTSSNTSSPTQLCFDYVGPSQDPCKIYAWQNISACFRRGWGNLTSAFAGLAAVPGALGQLGLGLGAAVVGGLGEAFEGLWVGGQYVVSALSTSTSAVASAWQAFRNMSVPRIYVSAATSHVVVGSTLFGSAVRLPTTIEVVLGVALCLVYFRFRGPGRLVAAAVLKFYNTLGALAILAIAVLGRPGRSALGLEVCFDVSGPGWDVPDGILPWCFAGVVSGLLIHLATFNHWCRGWKLRLYSRWAFWYSRVISWFEVCPFGMDSEFRCVRRLWFFACLFWPDECTLVLGTYCFVAICFDLFDMFLEACLCSQPSVSSVAALLEVAARARSSSLVRWIIVRARARGVLLYQHRGDVPWRAVSFLKELECALEPVSVSAEDLEVVRDAAGVLECGKFFRGKPVVARRGDQVIVGAAKSVGALPVGFVPCAPLVVRKAGRGVWSTLTTSVLGRDKQDYSGNVYVLGTAAGRSMGTCVGGVMFTTWHSSQGRTLAGPTGPLNPRWWSVSDDTAAYPIPLGSRCMDVCTCGTRSAWVMRRDGGLAHGELSPVNEVRLDVSGRVRAFRGASGSPVMCDQGHVVGMMVSVLHRGPDAFAVRYVEPWKALPADVQSPLSPLSPPPVPAMGAYEERSLFVPTGSGKSTLVPASYAKEGHKVLVLNPSVATTASMLDYMKELTGVSPSVFCGHGANAITRRTQSKITYATYGRFLARAEEFLKDADVVICDESHSEDATALLGIGSVIIHAKSCGVKLVLFATATPPGTQSTPHPRITEIPLTAEGDIPFYGFKLPAAKYQKGRHLVFVHSKAEATRLATAFTAHGCRAIYHYSGRDTSQIPALGDLVVVSTDALSTGYTGNFDTVTDCCVATHEEVEVDLDPTFTIRLMTRPINAGLRMQRRGRCGRGAAGTYYYALAASPPCGVVSSGAVWGAAEAAVSWYNMTSDQAARLLRAYAGCAYTCHISTHIEDATRAVAALSAFSTHPQVTRLRNASESWPLLVGAQRAVCVQQDAAPPGNDPRWAGLTGRNATPLLFRFGNEMPEVVVRHPTTDAIAEALGESVTETGAGPILLVGLAAAAALAIGDYTGSLVVVAEVVVEPGGNPVPPSGPIRYDGVPTGRAQDGRVGPRPLDDDQVMEALEEVVTQTDWSVLQNVWNTMTDNVSPAMEAAAGATRQFYDRHYPGLAAMARGAAERAAAAGAAAAQTLRLSSPPSEPVSWCESMLTQVKNTSVGQGFLRAWTALTGNIGPVVSLVTAAWAAGRSPPLACAASLLLGLQAALPLETRLPCAILAGAIGTCTGTPEAGLGMMGAFMVGGAVGSLSVFGFLLEVLGGWEATATTASFCFDLLTGKAKLKDAVFLIPALGAPGPALAGVAIGAVLAAALRAGPGQAWFNRVLSMVPRGQVLPDGYFLEEDVTARASELLKRMSISRAVMSVLECVHQQYETRTDGSVFWTIVAACLDGARRFLDWIIAYVKDRIPSVAIPLVSCQRGYTGPWVGSGAVTANCTCGALFTAHFVDGVCQRRTCTSVLCSARWQRGFPINTLGASTGPQPAPELEGQDAIHPMGSRDWVTLRRSGSTVTVVGASCFTITTALLRSAMRNPPHTVAGQRVTFRGGSVDPAMPYCIGARVNYDGQILELPFTVPAVDLAPPRPRAYVPPTQDELDSATGVPSTLLRAAALETPDSSVAGTVREAGVPLDERGMPEIIPPPPPTPALQGGAVANTPDNILLAPPLSQATPQYVTRIFTHVATVPMFPQGGPTVVRQIDTPPPSSGVTSAGQAGSAYSADVSSVGGAPSVSSAQPPSAPPSVAPSDSASQQGRAQQATYTVGFLSTPAPAPEPEPSQPLPVPPAPTSRPSSEIGWHTHRRPGSGLLAAMAIERDDVESLHEAMSEKSGEVTGAAARQLAESIVEEALSTAEGVHRALAATGALEVATGVTPTQSGSSSDGDTPASAEAGRVSRVMQAVRSAFDSVLGDGHAEAPSPGAQVAARVQCEAHGIDKIIVVSSRTLTLVQLANLAGITPHHSHIYSVRGSRRRPTLKFLKLCPGGGDLVVSCRGCPRAEAQRAEAPQPEQIPQGNLERVVRVTACCCGNDRAYTASYRPDTLIEEIARRAGVVCTEDHQVGLWHNGQRLVLSDMLRDVPVTSSGRVEMIATCGDASSVEETTCGYSYLWSGIPLNIRQRRRPPVTRPTGASYLADATKAYVTQMDMVGDRVSKVTILQRDAEEDSFLRDAFNLAKAKVTSHKKFPGWTYDEALAKTRSKTASSKKITYKDLFTPKGEAAVNEALDNIASGTDVPFTLTAKEEVFYKDKRTLKPPRLICFPPLEFRVAEKMILGDVGELAKTVLGDAYGFQYSPQQKVSYLLREWASKRLPMAITVDATCFDSSITPSDVEREMEIFACNHANAPLVRALGKYYASGPMVNGSGVEVGVRHCRASGVYTTSSANSITCWLKVSAACRKIGLQNPSFLIHGDDCLIICERTDDPCAARLKAALASYGYACDPEIHASLDTAVSCKTYLAECIAGKGKTKHYFMSTDFRLVLARACSEYGDPTASAGGYTLSYPWHPLTRHVLIPTLLTPLFAAGKSPRETICCEVAGNRIHFPLLSLPSILVSLHGQDVLDVRADSTKTLSEAQKALQALSMRGLSWYRKRATILRTRLIRAGGEWAYLARTLLATASRTASSPPVVNAMSNINELLAVWEHPYSSLDWDVGDAPGRTFLGRGVRWFSRKLGLDTAIELMTRHAHIIVGMSWMAYFLAALV